MTGTRKRGFTLIELVVTVAVIGLLAALAGPTLSKMTSRAKRSEAYLGLRAVAKAQNAFFARNGRFASDFYDLSTFQIEGGSLLGADVYAGERYVYRLSQPGGPGTYEAVATGDIDGDGILDVLLLRGGT